MQALEVTIKPATGESMTLTFGAGDPPHLVVERVAALSWIIRQLAGHSVDTRRRGTRIERPTASDELAQAASE